jgi:hypothetical protein
MSPEIRKEADRIITLKTIDELSGHVSNMALAIGTKMLRVQGWYGCTIEGEKVLFEVG